MGFRIYKAGNLSKPHEREQMNKLVQYLEREFTNRKEDCTLVIEPYIPAKLRDGNSYRNKPDALIIKDNVFVLLELKNWTGRIIADCRREAFWKKDDRPLSERNPFSQAFGHRHSLIDYLILNFVKNSYAPSWSRGDNYSQGEWIASNVDSWVITAENSVIQSIGTEPQSASWFRVMSLEELPNALSMHNCEPILSPSEMNRFIESLGAQLVHTKDWYRGQITNSSVYVGLIPKIVELIKSEQTDDIISGLKYIKELELNQHIGHVIECWHNKESAQVRQEALSILVDWSYDKLGIVLNEALNDPQARIVWFALDYLTKYGYVEPVCTLQKYLETGVTKAKVDAIKGIEISGSPAAQAILLNYANAILSNKPFVKFQDWKQKYEEHYKKVMARQEDKEYERLETERVDLLETSTAAINALGNLSCKQCIPMLMKVIDSPVDFGFPTNDYQELMSFQFSYFSLFESAVKAIGKLGIGDLQVTQLLINKLKTAPEDFQPYLIQALGMLGDKSAESAIIPFVENPDSYYFYEAAVALSKMRSTASFEYLSKAFLAHSRHHSESYLEKALANIDPRRFEKLLRQQINIKKDSDDEKRRLLWSLSPVVSLDSAPMLFSLLKGAFSETAAAYLGKFIADKEVFDRAIKLTESKNPAEQASGIWILERYYLEDFSRLAKFRKPDTPVEVRRTVSSLFSIAKAKEQLIEYSKDADPYVRRYVFWGLLEKGEMHHFCYIVNTHENARCEISIGKESLVIEFSDRISLIPYSSLEYGVVTSNLTGIFGIFLKTSLEEGLEKMLLVPIEIYSHLPSRASEVLLSELRLTKTELKNTEKSLVNLLWAKVPEDLLSKDEAE